MGSFVWEVVMIFIMPMEFMLLFLMELIINKLFLKNYIIYLNKYNLEIFYIIWRNWIIYIYLNL